MLTGTTDGNDLPSNQEVGYAKESLIKRTIFILVLELERLHGAGFVGAEDPTATVNKLADAAIRCRAVKEGVSFPVDAKLFAEKELQDLFKLAMAEPEGKLQGSFGNDACEVGPNDRELGSKAGACFAEERAPEEIEIIAGWYSEFGTAEIDAVFSKDAESNSAFTVAEEAYFAWYPEDNGDQDAAIDFWEQQTSSSGLPSPEFVRGFSEACFRHYANLVR